MKTKSRSLGYLILMTAAYTLGVAVLVTIHLIASDTYLLDVSTSISRYVGMKMWSAIAYIVLIMFICVVMHLFLRSLRPPLLYRVFGYAVAASLLSIAVFPHTAFGPVATDIHQILSRAVFILMMLHTITGVLCFPKKKRFIVPNAVVLLIDLALLIIAICSWETFLSYIFICESVLILAYLFSLFTVQREAADNDR